MSLTAEQWREKWNRDIDAMQAELEQRTETIEERSREVESLRQRLQEAERKLVLHGDCHTACLECAVENGVGYYTPEHYLCAKHGQSLRQRLQRADDALTRAHDALMVLAPKVLAALIAINEREAGQAEEAKEAEDDKQEPAD